MAEEYYIVTEKARENMVKARAGEITLPTATGMVFGDGGVDSAGNVKVPDKEQAELNHELLRKEFSTHSFVNETTCRYECILDESELVGQSISEIGLYDSNGDVLCVKNFSAKGKDEGLEMIFQIDDCF